MSRIPEGGPRRAAGRLPLLSSETAFRSPAFAEPPLSCASWWVSWTPRGRSWGRRCCSLLLRPGRGRWPLSCTAPLCLGVTPPSNKARAFRDGGENLSTLRQTHWFLLGSLIQTLSATLPRRCSSGWGHLGAVRSGPASTLLDCPPHGIGYRDPALACSTTVSFIGLRALDPVSSPGS